MRLPLRSTVLKKDYIKDSKVLSREVRAQDTILGCLSCSQDRGKVMHRNGVMEKLMLAEQRERKGKKLEGHGGNRASNYHHDSSPGTASRAGLPASFKSMTHMVKQYPQVRGKLDFNSQIDVLATISHMHPVY